jgi:molybdenum ABC transporter molybdate-binding protein
MNAKAAFAISIVLCAVLIGFLLWNPGERGGASGGGAGATTRGGGKSLLLYCAAGVRRPVEAVAAEYEKTYGVKIQIQPGASQTLLANMQLSGVGDLYLPADDSYITVARSKGLVQETAPLATMKPVLAVKRGNPKQIRALDDLLRPDVKTGFADPEAAAVGKVTRDALVSAGKWEPLAKKAVVTTPTVNDVANAIDVGTVDAGFVWDANVAQMKGKLEAVAVPEFSQLTAHVSLCVLKSSKDPTAALRFLRYLSSRDKGLPHFAREGYTPVEGDAWDESPRVLLYGGAMLRPAVEDTIAEFESREGCTVERVYNGCGILVGAMKTGQRPDAYFACDSSFMLQVKDLFLDAVDVSTNQLVILVKDGNRHGIHSLADLGKEGLRVGVGHEKQCALGALTQETLRQSGFEKSVRKNIVVESPTGDLLVNQLLTGSLDAAIAYVSNASGHDGELDAIRIDIPCALAVQPVAVGKESKHRQLTGRLLDRLRSAESRERFEAFGFRWK